MRKPRLIKHLVTKCIILMVLRLCHHDHSNIPSQLGCLFSTGWFMCVVTTAERWRNVTVALTCLIIMGIYGPDVVQHLHSEHQHSQTQVQNVSEVLADKFWVLSSEQDSLKKTFTWTHDSDKLHCSWHNVRASLSLYRIFLSIKYGLIHMLSL